MKHLSKTVGLHFLFGILTLSTLGIVYAAWDDTVSSGEALTADSWNEVIERVKVFDINGGNLGIKATNPSYILQIEDVPGSGDFFGIGSPGNAGNFIIGGNISNDGSGQSWIKFGDAGASANSGNGTVLRTQGIGNFSIFTGGTEKIRVERLGNVGIGTTDPTTKLHVEDNFNGNNIVLLSNTDTGSSAGAIFQATNGNKTASFGIRGTNRASFGGLVADDAYMYNSGNITIMADAGGDIKFAAGGNQLDMIIDSTNNRVGIGTTTPSSKLHVAGSITETSDIRLKENIQILDGSLNKLLALNGVNYSWKDSEKYNDKVNIGLIAQEVEQVFPELVNTDSEGYKSIEYSHMVVPLIEALKEQQTIIENLSKRIEILENK